MSSMSLLHQPLLHSPSMREPGLSNMQANPTSGSHEMPTPGQSSVLDLYSCYNKLTKLWQLKATLIYSSIVLVVRKLKLVSPRWALPKDLRTIRSVSLAPDAFGLWPQHSKLEGQHLYICSIFRVLSPLAWIHTITFGAFLQIQTDLIRRFLAI